MRNSWGEYWGEMGYIRVAKVRARPRVRVRVRFRAKARARIRVANPTQTLGFEG